MDFNFIFNTRVSSNTNLIKLIFKSFIKFVSTNAPSQIILDVNICVLNIEN